MSGKNILKSDVNPVFRTMLFVAIFWHCVYSETPGSFHANLTYSEQKAYFELAEQIHGKVAFTRSGRIKVVTLGDTVSQDLGLNGVASGVYAKFVRWSPDGKKLAVLTSDTKIYVMDAVKNAQLKFLVTSNNYSVNCPLEFHTNGYELLYSKDKVIWAVNINNGTTRKPIEYSECDGEIGISADGNRMVWRGLHKDLHKYDFVTNIDETYFTGVCSAGISPDGTMVMNNTMAHDGLLDHQSIFIWDFEITGELIDDVIISDGLPDPYWDNHHWSNSNDWIAAKGHFKKDSFDRTGWGEAYIIDIHSGTTYRASWESGADYPDLWVDLDYSSVETENSNVSTSKNNCTGVRLTNENGSKQLNISATGRHEFHVFNILGQLLYTREGVGPSSYGLAFLRSGLYIIQIQTQLGTSVQKLVIVR